MPISRIHWWCGVSSPETRPLWLTETDIVGWFELIPTIGLNHYYASELKGFPNRGLLSKKLGVSVKMDSALSVQETHHPKVQEI